MANGLFTLKQQLQGLIQGAWSGTGPSNAPKQLEYLVVAGGGGGGYIAGGAGAGGLLQGLFPIVLGQSYTVTVGSGGAGGTGGAAGSSGGNTSLGSITAVGGGAGGSYPNAVGATGGSGGGANNGITSGGLQGTVGQGTAGQGNAGGRSYAGSNFTGGGGGGAGTVGLTSVGADNSAGGNGGAGIASSISGTFNTYAGGGGGAADTGGTAGLGGVGGGGAGGVSRGATGGTGTINGASGGGNTGGGGGGYGVSGTGGTGGSGIVIVRYRGNTQYFSGGTLSYDSVNNYTVHTFYASGTLAPLATPTTYGILNSLTKSLRFRSSNTAYLSRTPGSTSNQKTYTWSSWVKLGIIPGSTAATTMPLFQAGANASNIVAFYYYAGKLWVQIIVGGTTYNTTWNTSSIYADPSSWYHVVISVDTTQTSATNFVKIYVNGVSLSLTYALNAAGTIPQSYNTFVNLASTANAIGQYFYSGSATSYLDGYLAEVNFIDGQALTPQSFGTLDPTSGVWTPMAYSGSYGTNGFHLPFTNTTSTTTLGYDTSGNSNNWSTSGFSLTAGSTYDSMNDVPTLTSATASNYAVWNPNDVYTSSLVLSNGNLSYSASSGFWGSRAAFGMTSGKWYWENTITTATQLHGVMTSQSAAVGGNFYPGIDAYGWGYYGSNGNKFNNNSSSSYGATYTTGDVIGVAFDAGAGTLTFYKNGTSQGVAFTGLTNGPYFPAFGASAASGSTNFGQQAFVYTPPSGFVALNTYNLPTPTIVRGNQYMDATTYNGNGVSNVVMNAGSFQPDLVWTKVRNQAYGHALFDSVRGVGNALQSNNTNAEAAWGSSTLSSFNSNGFGLGADTTYLVVNSSGNTFVGWQWQAGKGSSSSNTNGTITSTVSVNQTAGFSIATYTGNNTSTATFGHGLATTPIFVIIKRRNSTSDWFTVFVTGTTVQRMSLNTTAASSSSSPVSTYVTSTTVQPWYFDSSGSGLTNVSGGTYVAYCFSQIDGFSAFGSYTGNGSTTGPFIYCGFQPKFILIKASSAVGDWVLVDTTRNPYNTVANQLAPNTNVAETTNANLNLNALSNGFQITGIGGGTNSSGATYIYMAFASNPFKYSNAF